jgi:hypothetical protein
MRGFVLHAVAHPGQHDGDQHHAGGRLQRRGNQRRDQQAGQETEAKLQGVLQRSGAAGRLREWLQGLRDDDR